MYNGNKVIAIIVAAGSGKRFGSTLPKQFLKIGSETVLQKSVRAFNENEYVDEIIIVTSAEYISLAAELCDNRFIKASLVAEGGKERQDSVLSGLAHYVRKSGCDSNLQEAAYTIVLVHDAARPFVSQQVINNVIEAVEDTGAAVPAVPVKDTIRQAARLGDFGNMEEWLDSGVACWTTSTLERGKLCSVQTPQGFYLYVLGEAYKNAYESEFFATDDASLVERMGIKISVVQGDHANYKITTREDMDREMRIGSGFDVHRLVEDRKLFLCGVEIPHEKGLLGHSDADVALHALMDALLGAAALGDIGKHFPDSDERYKGISSMKLLEEVFGMISEEGFSVGNVDVTIMAQRPKIAPFIPQMKKSLAEALRLDESAVNIKGTTTEKLGFVGREEGIAAEAVCTLYRN